jgi:ATP-dependent DNA helicase DinG
MCARIREPFEYTNREDFHAKLVEWIGDVLYDILPDHGYEIRDEQIFTAFQIADAICNKNVHLAEAGLGTGKTFAYLLSAIPYARFSKKPVVIACATTALQEQLAGDKGDIKTLFNLLGLEIDARMAKDPHQYICDLKASEFIVEIGEKSKDLDELDKWMNRTKLGERSEIPTIPDHIWKKISWDESMSCETCDNRGYCKLIKAREHYRMAGDLIIVDHETFFQDLWTREERISDGKLPILPSYSAVIFDEGHKVMLPAAMKAGHQINQDEIQNMIYAFEEIQGIRYSLGAITTTLEEVSGEFFMNLSQSLIKAESTERLSIHINETLIKSADTFRKTLDHLLLELQIEQELYIESLSSTQIQSFEGIIERAILGLNRFVKNNGTNVITWVDEKDGAFWVVPRNLSELLDRHLYKKGLPVVFTSATLSNEGNFDYMIRTLGIKNPSKSSVGSPFEIEEKVVVDLSQITKDTNDNNNLRIQKMVSLLKENGGRALVLANSIKEVRKIRKKLEGYQLPFDVLWEDKADRGFLLRKFKEEESSVLIGANFWEGIDVPGDALTLLIIWQLPFPSLDPLIEAKRKDVIAQGLDPVITVDYPEMGLKLKQGCGRLIRSNEDKGAIVFLDSVMDADWEKVVMGALPIGAEIKSK